MRDVSESEKAVAGIILSEPERAVVAALEAGVTPDWFADDTWRVMWIGVKRLWDAGHADSLDSVSIRNEALRFAETSDCKKKYSPRVDLEVYEDAIVKSPPSANLDYHLNVLHGAYIEREVRRVGQKFAKSCNSGADAIQAAAALASDISGILAGVSASKKISLGAICAEIMSEYETAHQKRVVEKNLAWTPGYTFPWSPMTNMMNGLEPGLGIIAARPSVGKTLFALNLIRYWCESGVHVCFCSLDMEQRSLTRRFIAETARVSIKKARYTPTETDLDAMRSAVAAVEKWPLDFVEIRDVDEFCAHVEIERAAGRAQIAVVDYLGLMHSSRIDNAREYDRVSYVSDRLKALANRIRIPVIALAQLNRDVAKAEDGRMPNLSDLRGSGSIEQDAFWVAFLHRDTLVKAAWSRTPPLQLVPDAAKYPAAIAALDPIHFVVAKAQNGECFSLPFVFRKQYLTCSLGDYRATPNYTTTGYGATQRQIADHSPRFAKICTDWRHDPLEPTLRKQGALIDLDAAITIDEPAATPAPKPPPSPPPKPPPPDDFSDDDDPF